MNVTRRKFLVDSSVLILATAASKAAEPWTDKNPEEWTPHDLDTILNHSPWVREVTPEMDPSVVNPGQGSRKKPQSSGILTEFKIQVRWESGLPVRLARRNASLPDAGMGQYWLSLNRLPLDFLAASSGRGPDDRTNDRETIKARIASQIQSATSLLRDGRASIPANQATWMEGDFSQPRLLLFFSPGNEPIRIEDYEVTLATRIDFLVVRVRFGLKAMLYRGKLEV